MYAEDQEDALFNATQNLKDLNRDQQPYDYFVTFDENGNGVAGKDRWGDLPAAVEKDSEKGQELIEEGWQSQKKQYQRALKKLEDYFESSDDPTELIEDTHDDLIRHEMHKLGCYKGFPVFFYDNYGAGIQTKKQLDRALESPNHAEQKVWIVPVDVHF